MTGTLFVILATFFWALDALIRYPLMAAGFSAIQIVFVEHLMLVGMMTVWLKLTRQKIWGFSKADLPALLVIGGLGSAVATLAFTKAFGMMNPTIVILLQKLQPVVAISLAALVLQERIKVGFILCVALALSGSLLMILDDILGLASLSGWHYSEQMQTRLLGYLFALIAVVGWGASTVFGKKLALRGYASGQIMQGRFSVGLVVLIPFMVGIMPAEQAIDMTATAKIALMVLISGLLGMVLYYQGLKRIASRHSALAEMAFPVMAGIINWVALGFALTPVQIVGGILLIAASFAVHLEMPNTANQTQPA